MEFRERLLSDVLDIQWGDTKTTKAKYSEDGYVAFSASGPDGFLPHFDYDEPGVVLSAIGANCGKTFLAIGKWSCIKNTMRMISRSDELSVKYFFYLSQQKDFFPIRGSAQPFISQTDIRELKIQIPDRNIQDAIAGFIESLADKIRLNNDLSQTLEAIAQTIFKSWFIDFDPVHARMRGEKPEGMDDATAALFSESFEESELGLIPSGWQVGSLYALCGVRYGAPFASKMFNSEGQGKPLIRIRDLKDQTIATWSEELHPKGFLVAPGGVVIGMDGEFNPTIWLGPPALVNQRICMLEPKDSVSEFHLFFALQPIMKRIERGSTGSTVIHLGKSDMDQIRLACPSNILLTAYKNLMQPLLQQMVNLAEEARNLMEIRDALLPRLISGELEILEENFA